MKNTKFSIIISTLFFIAVFSGCMKDKLEIENLNNPDMSKVLASPNDLKGVASGLYREWFTMGHSSSYGPAMPLITMADHQTCSWGNFAMRALSSEPRASFNNSPTYDYAANFQYFVETRFSVISQANDVLTQVILNNAQIGTNGSENSMVTAWTYFNRGLAYAQIGMLYDKSVIATHDNMTNSELQPYTAVMAQAIADFDEALTYCNDGFVLPESWFAGVSLTNDQLKKMINSYAARYMVLGSRTAAENTANGWAKIKTYAQNGIDFDLSIMTDGDQWYSSYIAQSASPTWLFTDMRVINMMAPTYPARYANDGTPPNPKQANSADARLSLYFTFVESCGFRPERGYYHFSHYKFNRYSYTYDNWLVGLVYDYKTTENDLYLAEAILRTGGSKADAAALINKTRVSIGTLSALSGASTDQELYNAVFYERTLELAFTGVGIEFCDMRRRDMLQEGTLLHFPVPGSHLDIYGLENYTYGGVANADGVNTSNGGWETK